jgi:hypothetical protein
LKLPQLLSQYLYQHRKMDLPGIGTFTLDAGTVIPQESDRVGQVAASGISFKNATIYNPEDTLVVYIKEHTGKMKSLAAADLDFFLTTGRQLLNIGKPFYIEGIGTLTKTKDGKLDFAPGDYLISRLDEPSSAERRGANSYDEPPRDESRNNNNSNNRQMALLVGLIAGLILIGWGGYYLYKRNNFVEPTTENRATVIPDTPATKPADSAAVAANSPGSDTAAKVGTSAALTKVDTPKADATVAKPAVKPPPPAAPAPAATVPAATPPVAAYNPVPTAGQSIYRFVILRTENKGHALRRYNQLLGYQLNIKLEQKDSTFFKLYFPIATVPRDTTHIRDSLADVYASHVSIEH